MFLASARTSFHRWEKKNADISTNPVKKEIGMAAITQPPSRNRAIRIVTGMRPSHSTTRFTVVEYLSSPMPLTKEIMQENTEYIQQKGSTTCT